MVRARLNLDGVSSQSGVYRSLNGCVARGLAAAGGVSVVNVASWTLLL